MNEHRNCSKTNTVIVENDLWQLSPKLKIKSPYALSVPLLELYSKQMKTVSVLPPVFIREVCTVIFFAAKLTLAKIQN